MVSAESRGPHPLTPGLSDGVRKFQSMLPELYYRLFFTIAQNNLKNKTLTPNPKLAYPRACKPDDPKD